MTRTSLSIAGFAVALSGLVVLAGCGSSGSSTTASSSTQAAAPTTTGGAATIDVADNPKLGQVLVDSQGNTVYMFEKDESDESYCNGSCAKVWPPVTTNGQAKAGSGVSGKLTTLKRDDGSTQVVFDGHPLYTYVKDTDTEDAYGNGLAQFGAEWYGLRPNGQKTEGGSQS